MKQNKNDGKKRCAKIGKKIPSICIFKQNKNDGKNAAQKIYKKWNFSSMKKASQNRITYSCSA